MIKESLEEYQPRNQEEATAALLEIMQDIALAGLMHTFFWIV